MQQLAKKRIRGTQLTPLAVADQTRGDLQHLIKVATSRGAPCTTARPRSQGRVPTLAAELNWRLGAWLANIFMHVPIPEGATSEVWNTTTLLAPSLRPDAAPPPPRASFVRRRVPWVGSETQSRALTPWPGGDPGKAKARAERAGSG
eukprot:CAMPEP_0181217474 /NCGR_PEP_ID=MMETSP1096-20121128/27168_1 /TAXON_ID=156174 ORGANISM="Chrysochromulina ericina, Strain CCMP281" /NCGR_SAMPLE_ID=MMETSP1096 /ASSEMBLY_ACC=CAM_ASM_000453 /LENGTH=146 /DNA_ID=CAMNT_0023309603 /DNA_START=239 /DNA_END=680 /DNA_ORIENTATION=+